VCSSFSDRFDCAAAERAPRAFVAAMTADTACTEGGGGQKDGVAWWMRKM